MKLTREWRRQATKAAGLTALAPAVLLGAAVLLAAGAGFGGLSSLGQITGGPSLPAVEQSVATAGNPSDASPAQAPVAALAAAPAPAPTAAGGGSSSGQGGSGGPQVRTNAPVGRPQSPAIQSPGTRAPTQTPTPTTSPNSPSTGTSPSTPSPPSQTAPITPQAPATPQLPPTPGPVQQLLDLPRQLPAPIGPLTDRVLQPVTGLLLPR